MINAGDFVAGATVPIPFNTFDSNGASVTVTDLVAGDVHIHKDAGTAERTSANGVTASIDFDGITGNHLITIDTSDDTDAGFYAPGSDYAVRLEGITVNGQTLNAWIGMFSVENRLFDAAIPELGVGIPTATPTPRTAAMLLYMALRDSVVVQTSGVDALEIYNSAGVKITQKLISDDGADYTEDKMISGA